MMKVQPKAPRRTSISTPLAAKYSRAGDVSTVTAGKEARAFYSAHIHWHQLPARRYLAQGGDIQRRKQDSFFFF